MNILITGEKGDLGGLFFNILKKKHHIFLTKVVRQYFFHLQAFTAITKKL